MKRTEDKPFKFLDSYTKNDRNIFFGRDQEIEDLYTKVFQSKLLLVYGASGTGKSSIINCGLANKFNESDWQPVHIRRGGNISQSMFNQLQKETAHEVTRENQARVSAKDLNNVINAVFLDHFKPIYLIFDQFEELFIFGDKEEWMEFIANIRALMDGDLEVHFIFVIRGEYLEYLSEFEERIPEFFNNRMRVEKMTRKKAMDSISGPANLFDIRMEEGFEENLLKKLNPDSSQVELTFLQVFLDRIYRNALDENSGDVFFSNDQLENMGQIGDILAEFVDEQLFKMEDPKAALSVLKSFVSLKGTKTQMSVEAVIEYTRDIGKPLQKASVEKILTEFVNKRILKEKDENDHYELRHDSLALKIFEKITHQERELLDIRQFITQSYDAFQKRGILISDEDLSYIAPYERQLSLPAEVEAFIEQSKKNSNKQKKQRRRRTILSIIFFVLFLSAIAGFIYSQQQKKKAEEFATLATQESEEAQRQKSLADDQRTIAEQNAEQAKMQTAIALDQTVRAEQLKSEADRQRAIALQQKQIAESEKQQADVARQRAETSEAETQAQNEIISEQRQVALQLRILSLAREMAIKSAYMVDREIKALIALQAFHFNERYNGNPYQADIFNALFLARNEYEKKDYNAYRAHSHAIKKIFTTSQGILSASNDGKVFRSTGQPNNVSELLIDSNYIFECMALTANEEQLILGTQKGEVILFDTRQKKIIFEKKVHPDEVVNIIARNDGFISFSRSGKIDVADAAGNSVVNHDLKEILTDAIQSKDEKNIYVSTQSGKVLVLDASFTVSLSIPSPLPVSISRIGLHSVSNTLVIGYTDGQLILWDLSANQIAQKLLGHTAAISGITFDSNGEFLGTSSFDRTARIWNLDRLTEHPIIVQDSESWISSVVFDSRSASFITGSFNGTIRTFPINPQKLTAGLCDKIGRNMTEAEWIQNIADDIPYETTCTHE